MAPLPTRDYREIVDDLVALEGWLTKLGLRRGPDRLRGVVANIREIEKARSEGKLLTLNAHPRLDELVWSLVEGQEFAEIFRGVLGDDPQTIKRLMQKALGGPLHPLAETRVSNVARNTNFELILAARLRQKGASVALGELADLVIAAPGSRLYVECKRPLFEQNIRRRVEQARGQLKQRFAADSSNASVGGLVAVSISKVLNPGSKIFVVSEEKDLQSLTEDVKRIHQQHGEDYDRLVDPRMIGMLYHIFTPAFVRKTGRLFYASHTEFFS